jgi:site-specific recombinase XerC
MSTNFPSLLQAFFTDRLLRQRNASPHTVAGYRDSFRLLLRFAAQRLRKVPSKLSLEDLDAAFIGEIAPQATRRIKVVSARNMGVIQRYPD